MGIPVIVGVGYTKVGEFWYKDIYQISYEALKMLMNDYGVADVDALYVGNALSSYYDRQLALASHIADTMGLYDISVSTFSSGGASSAQAIYNAILGVISGQFESVIVGGVEKMSEELPSKIVRGVSLVEKSFFIDYIGLTSFSLHALVAKIYMDRFKLDREDLSALPILEHENSSRSKHSQFRNKITYEMIINAPLVSEPLTIFDVSAPGDGAAFIAITSEEYAMENGLDYVKILGMGSASQPANPLERPSPYIFEATSRALDKALRQAGKTIEEIDLIEIYNPTSISGLLILDSLGLGRRGESAKMIRDGFFSLDGRVPINTFGGAKARGDPKGASTAYQFVEVFLQHMNMAGDNQVSDMKYSLIHSMVGFDISSYIFILGDAR
ncbi:TPA: thiolase family protein [Candidatus Geothermarchaeota archaeon]|nr:thiolase family protein [Candidatus Geothermarchaeota archaeon]HIQ13806.1 thiolase family protein [Thermoprotei archaeon]